MRRTVFPLAGALAFMGITAVAWAQTEPTTTTTTTHPTTTTEAPVPTTAAPAPTTTAPRPAPTVTPPTTTAAPSAGKPVPPPASGASQPLDPSLLGGTPIPLGPPTTLFGVESTLPTAPATTVPGVSALTVGHKSNGPTGLTLGLAAVAWLASLGGLLVYAEDQRSKQWQHLAR